MNFYLLTICEQALTLLQRQCPNIGGMEDTLNIGVKYHCMGLANSLQIHYTNHSYLLMSVKCEDGSHNFVGQQMNRAKSSYDH